MAGDYTVDFGELEAFGKNMRTSNDATWSEMTSAAVGSFATAMAGGEAAAASGRFAGSFDTVRSQAGSHMDSHPDTLIGIAQAYTRIDDDADTEIRGFFEGRNRP